MHLRTYYFSAPLIPILSQLACMGLQRWKSNFGWCRIGELSDTICQYLKCDVKITNSQLRTGGKYLRNYQWLSRGLLDFAQISRNVWHMIQVVRSDIEIAITPPRIVRFRLNFVQTWTMWHRRQSFSFSETLEPSWPFLMSASLCLMQN